jgi:formamidopyrimidine-DNA glycosylase
MPEGPEVCLTAQYLLSKLKGRIISNCTIVGGKYLKSPPIGINNITKKDKYKILNIDSKGKVMWFELKGIQNENELYIVSQFGLEGNWGFYNMSSSRVKFLISNKSNNKTYNLYFNDNISYGSITFYTNKDDLYDKLNKLAPDLLKSVYDTDVFTNMINEFLKQKKNADAILGKVLMNQNKSDGIGCGVGNYLAPEIMYMARLSPHRKMSSLTKSDIKNLCNAIKYKMKLAYIGNTTKYMSNINVFLLHHRNGIANGLYPNYHSDVIIQDNINFAYEVYQQDVDPNGLKVTKDKSVNTKRITHWVKDIQK